LNIGVRRMTGRTTLPQPPFGREGSVFYLIPQAFQCDRRHHARHRSPPVASPQPRRALGLTLAVTLAMTSIMREGAPDGILAAWPTKCLQTLSKTCRFMPAGMPALFRRRCKTRGHAAHLIYNDGLGWKPALDPHLGES
jgi:hypothetical protein